jgi:hypothetical protein
MLFLWYQPHGILRAAAPRTSRPCFNAPSALRGAASPASAAELRQAFGEQPTRCIPPDDDHQGCDTRTT